MMAADEGEGERLAEKKRGFGLMTSQKGAMLSDGIISPPSSFNHILSLIQVNGGYKSESMRDGIVKQCRVGGGRESVCE